MAPATRRRTGNGGGRQAAAAAADGDDATATKGRQRRSLAKTKTPATPTTTTPASPTTFLTAAEAADARELEELGGIDPATSFLYTPHTLIGLGIGIALLIYYTGAFSSYTGGSGGGGVAVGGDGDGNGGRRGLVAALATWLLYCLLQGSPRMPLLRPHPAVWRLVHGAAVAYLLALVWLLCQTASGARGALALLYPDLGKPLPERSYGGDCGLFRRKAATAADNVRSSSAAPPSLSSSFFSASFSSVSSSLLAFPSLFGYELNLAAIKSTLLDEFVVAHTLGWWAKAVLLRDRRLLWPLSVGFELAEASLAHALPNFNECWWDSWVLDVAVCNLVGMELGMATAALLREREQRRQREQQQERGGGSGGGVGVGVAGGSCSDAWGGVSTKRGALAKARRVAAQFSPRSWEERDWSPGSSPRRAGWALFLVAAFLLFDLNSFFLKAALWVPQLNPLTVYRLVGFFLLGLPAFQEFYRFVVAGEERARERQERKRLEESGLLPPALLLPATATATTSNRLGPCAWLMLAIIAAETLVAVKFGPSLLGVAGGGGSGSSGGGGGSSGSRRLPRSAVRALSVFGIAAAGLAGSWLCSGLRAEEKERRRREGSGASRRGG